MTVMMTTGEACLDSKAYKAAKPKLSVLAPFYREDPSSLLRALDAEAGPLAGVVEIVTLDDGSADDHLTGLVSNAVSRMASPARFIRLAKNVGRARGRNRLAAEARGEWLLFLDSDMAPDSQAFLGAYLDLIAAEAPPVVCGGFSLHQAPDEPILALHRHMALKSDCLTAAQRNLNPEKHVFTSNLLVRRDVFETVRFDEDFRGWGWEDVEWAMRVARQHPILHIDNPATHLGLDPASVIAAKYEQSAANFARVVAEHLEVVETYPSYRLAKAMKRAPLRQTWRPILKSFALAERLPLGARDLAMRLYRAALYAEAV
jgi:glycosyltransferase involved in cell wall biosynthesis